MNRQTHSNMDKEVKPHLFVVLGATGDLMHRKLLPALFHLGQKGLLRKKSLILGAGRRSGITDEDFRQQARESLAAAGVPIDDPASRWCSSCLHYQSIGKGTEEDYRSLGRRIEELEQTHGLPGNRAFYLALPPAAFPPTISGLAQAGLNQSKGWTRLVIEKPFGHDLASARELNRLVHHHFEESQIYRIDHYLGKETVQNFLAFRFANPIFESLWNRDRIDSVEITVAESLGIEDRAGYYDRAGALRDMMQNHLTQLLTLTAMEVPAAFDAESIRHEKVKVLRSIPPLRPEDVVFGQYARGQVEGKKAPGYLEETGVPPDSHTETFVAMRVEVANWRWQGVPFYLRTGKRLPQRLSRIVITFRRPPVSVFVPTDSTDSCSVHSNTLVITLQPDEGFDLHFEVKTPRRPITLKTQRLSFRYAETFEPLSGAYETLLLDVLTGEQTLFVRADEVEASWRLHTPLLDRRAAPDPYRAGTWGPTAADRLPARENRIWLPV